MSTISNSPSTRNGPSFRTMILVGGILPPWLISWDQLVLILRHSGVYFIRPCQYAALEVQKFPEACFLQKLDRIGRALSAAAMDDHLSRTIEFVHAPGEFSERN